MGGSGSGGGGRIDKPLSPTLQRKIDELKKETMKELNADIESFIKRILSKFDDRDREITNNRLVDLQHYLGEEIEVDHVLFGGSVAKHTEVDGISDIDALVILDRSDLSSKPPSALLNTFHKILDKNLPRSQIETVTKGNLAVTVRYRDGEEIQLLPAIRSQDTISIASPDGRKWSDTNPKVFQRELTRANDKMNHALVPSIKLFKSINSDLPKSKRLTGYHIEAMAVEAVKGYNGAKTPRALLVQILDHASNRVLDPIKDKTGQTISIDAYLGNANSDKRKNMSQILLGYKRRLETAITVSQWRAVFESE